MTKLSSTVSRVLENATKAGAWIYNAESLRFELGVALKRCSGVGHAEYARTAKELGIESDEARAIDLALTGEGVRPYALAVRYGTGDASVMDEGPDAEDMQFVERLAAAGFEGGCVVRVVELPEGEEAPAKKKLGKGWKTMALWDGKKSRTGLFRADGVTGAGGANGWFTGDLPVVRGERCRCTKRYSCPLAKAGKCKGADTDLLTPLAEGELRATVGAVDAYLTAELEKFRAEGRTSVLLRAGDVHDWMGIYPPRHATVCYAMCNLRERLRSEVVREPKKHLGSNLCVRYYL